MLGQSQYCTSAQKHPSPMHNHQAFRLITKHSNAKSSSSVQGSMDSRRHSHPDRTLKCHRIPDKHQHHQRSKLKSPWLHPHQTSRAFPARLQKPKQAREILCLLQHASQAAAHFLLRSLQQQRLMSPRLRHRWLHSEKLLLERNLYLKRCYPTYICQAIRN